MAKKRRIEKRTTVFDLIPYIIIVAVVPFIVRLHLDQLEPVEAANWKGGDVYADLLSYFKSQWFIIASAFGLCLFILKNIQGRIQLKKSSLYIPAALYFIFIILSTFTSKYVSVALSGFVARYENMFVLLFYLVNMLILFNLINEERQIRILFGWLMVSASIICLIGLTQFMGHDFFETGFGKSFILPAQYADSELDFKFGTMIYGTLINPNYVGSYVALVFPLAVASIFLARKKGFKIAVGVLAVLLLVNLIGSESRAGLVGLGAGILVAIIYFRKFIFRNKVVTIILLITVLAAGAFGVKKASGVLSNEIGDGSFYVEDILFQGNYVDLVSSTEVLRIKLTDSNLSFHDANDNQLEIDVTEDKNQSRIISFTSPAYKKYTVGLTESALTVNKGNANFTFNMTSDGLRLLGNNKEVGKVEKPAAIDIRGYEKLGSARAYIWSRTIPLLKNTVLVGTGPDTFVIEFPQDDYIGKINAYNTPNMIVDKPHNIYLQIGVNTGVLSLMAFLALVVLYIITSMKAYFLNPNRSALAVTGVAIFIGICSYLAAGLFNDSVIAVAPVFWVLLGAGFSCNNMIVGDRVGHKVKSPPQKK